MALPALATSDDLTRFGYTPPATADAMLARASARIRLAAGHQEITADTSTVTFPPNGERCLKLWQFPVTSVHAVTTNDGSAVTDYTLVGNEIWLPHRLVRFLPFPQFTVTYSHGYAVLPDELVELTCQVAMRMSGTKPDRDPAIQAQTVGDVSQTLNPAALSMTGGLLPGEEATIRRIFYYRG
jgi:hypothetical protein